jgi:DNA mismatch repair ATPase MutL
LVNLPISLADIMPIAPLPQSAIRVIGSTSALSDPCSVIKELIDNSLDASATSISVDISSNTLDIIQVKDNGCGIPPEDREFVCKLNFTSRIQTLEDLRNVGGASLGFRGAALAGVAEMSGEVVVTTRIDGEAVAAAMKYGRTGELLR